MAKKRVAPGRSRHAARAEAAHEAGALALILCWVGAFAAFLFWCYAAFASWLTRGGDEDED